MPSPPPPPTIYLLDPNGNAWLLQVSNGGERQQTLTVSPSSQPVNSIILMDVGVSGQFWSVGVAITGELQITSTLSTTAQTQIYVQSSNGTWWGIQVDQGEFQTAKICQNDWQVGLQYIPDWNNIAWSQPNGINTTVYPQQANGPWPEYPVSGQFFIETSGLFTTGCGHFFDAPQVFQDFDCINQTSVALICCPVCTFLSYTVEPFFEAVYSDPQFGVPYLII